MTTPATCGTCAHGVAIDHGMVRCGLGWDAHDGLAPSCDIKTKKTVPVTMPHGELEHPEATPNCSCGCRPSRWQRKPA